MIYESVAISIVPRFPIAIAREDNIARPLSIIQRIFRILRIAPLGSRAFVYTCTHIEHRKKETIFIFVLIFSIF